MTITPRVLAVALALSLGAGIVAGCGGSDSMGGAGTTTAAERKAAAADFSMASQREVTLKTSKYSSGDWEPGASPANINGVSLTYGTPVAVPLGTKGGKEATFVLSVLGQTTKVKIQGSTCMGFTGDWYSGYAPERGMGSGSKIACAGQGLQISGTNQF